MCKSSGQVLGVLNGINEESCSLTVDIYGRYELSFDVNEYIYSGNELVKANYYDEISMLMQLFIPSIGYFIINSSPTSKADSEVKSVAATSIDSELENKNTTFKINCGTEDSLEYIVTYDESETETLLNGYTGLPYDYITIYNNYDEILEEVLQKYNAEYYGCYDDAMEHYYSYPERFDEIIELCNLIPRLQRKVVETEVTNDDGTTSTVSYIEEYIIITYDESDNTKIKQIEFATGGDLDLWFENRLFDLREFYKKHKSQLSLMDYICAETNNAWSIGHIDEQFYNKKVRFEIESESIYSFLTQELSSAIEGIFTFDIINKKINLYAVENLGEDTGINLAYDTVQNQLDVSCDENSIFTRFKVSGGEDLSIKQVNYGTDIIEDLSYFMNYRDSNGKRLYVTDDLYKKYQKYLKYREDNRDTFISLSDQINKLNEEIKEIMYRVPNDGLKTDWNTYTTEELTNLLTTYNNMLVSLITLYKNDYGANGCNEDGSVNEEYLKDTIYWYDYCAYKEIITQIEDTIIIKTDTTLSEEKEKELEAEIDAYKTEWTLYGSKELTNLIESYENKISAIKDKGSLEFYEEGNTLPNNYYVGDPIPWEYLSDIQKAEYNKDLAGTYPIRCTTCKELCDNKRNAQKHLDTLNKQIDEINKQLEEPKEKYNELATNATPKNFSINGEKVFTNDDLKCLFNLYIDTDYTNENILTTSSDTVSSNLEHSKELLADAKEKLSIESQPQYTFSISMDNILHIDGFEGIVEQFKLGNFIYIEYKNDIYVKMRLVSYTYNPMIVDNELSVEFSNIIKSATKRNDFTYLLDNATGSSKGSSSSSGGSGGSSSAFGDDLDVTMTNTMLSKLLNTELFGTRVSNVILDTIDVNGLTAKYATFGDLFRGTTTIDGACIKTGKIESTTNTSTGKPYTIINLDDGSFSFADEKLYYNPDIKELVVKGTIYATNGSFSGTITSSSIESTIITSTTISGGTIAIGNNFSVDENGNMTANNGNFTGNIHATSLVLDKGVMIGTSYIDGLSSVATSGNYNDLTNIPTIPTDVTQLIGGSNILYTNQVSISTSSTSNGITTHSITVGDKTYTSIETGDFVLTNIGISSIAADGSENYVYISKEGLLTAKNALIYGTIYATNGMFSGKVTASEIESSKINMGNHFVVDENGNVFSGLTTTSAIKISKDTTWNKYSVNFAWVDTADEYAEYEENRYLHLYMGETFETPVTISATMSSQMYFGEIRLRSRARVYENLIVGGRIYSAKNICPKVNGEASLGASGSSDGEVELRWNNIYLKNSPNVSSDAKLKHDIKTISDKYEKLFYLIEPRTFIFNGEDTVHIGTVAQSIETAMNTVGLSNKELNALCKSKKTKTVTDENGKSITVPDLDKDGNEQYSYGVRYEEFIMLNTHMLQKLYKKVDEQQKEIDELKTIVNELLERLA